MLRLRALASALAATLILAAPALASGDFREPPQWRLIHRDLTGYDNMMMLSPGNDTRVNLALLLADRRGMWPVSGAAKPVPLPLLFDWRTLSGWLSPAAASADSNYASGEGSRCRSNDSGAAAFVAAVNAAKLPGGEAVSLIATRRGFTPNCAASGAVMVSRNIAIQSPAGSAFALYLEGTMLFYGGDFDSAARSFVALRDTPNPWLRETARYMAARVEVNRAQVGLFDDYGSFAGADRVDQKAIAAADAGLHAYLKDYSKGAFAASARGLLRRVYWFGGKRDRLAAEYAGLFDVAPGARGLSDVDLADEIDNKLLADLKPGDTSDPTLLAVRDLQLMRSAEDEGDAGCCTDILSAEQLNAQRAAFSGNPALFDLLLAARAFYVERKPAEVLRLIPDAAKQASFSQLQFSRQVLRGLALEATGDRLARGFWIEMFGGAKADPQHSLLELALAMHDERAGALGKVFAAGSPVDDARIRQILLANVADAALLRRQAKAGPTPRERELALYVLLYKEVSRGAYRDFLSDVALVPAGAPVEGNDYFFDSYDEEDATADAQPLPLGRFVNPARLGDYGCPALSRTVTTLAATPGDAHALLCFADYFRANGFDQYALDTQPSKDQLGGTPTLFAGPVYSRQQVYKKIIADPRVTGDDKAYALYRAVMCYAPSGNNTCGGSEVDKPQRKAWFTRLRSEYPRSRWAADLRYYW